MPSYNCFQNIKLKLYRFIHLIYPWRKGRGGEKCHAEGKEMHVCELGVCVCVGGGGGRSERKNNDRCRNFINIIIYSESFAQISSSL
jgi:hypothetical protein